MTRLAIVRLPHGEGLPLPEYQSEAAAGMDLRAACPEAQVIEIASGERALIPTGLVIEIPAGYEGQIRPRSGLALKHGITCLNTPGTIDSDYRGEVMILLINHGDENFVVERGMRVAQLVIAKVEQLAVAEVSLSGKTGRGDGGFGSTGV